jgi:peptidoglycan-associated lipoprotein
VYLEIQGHTDSVGPEDWNLILGKKRAEAVWEYLYKQHHIPLHRMQVISLGGSVPVGDNKTADGRAQNRRVEILVYE